MLDTRLIHITLVCESINHSSAIREALSSAYVSFAVSSMGTSSPSLLSCAPCSTTLANIKHRTTCSTAMPANILKPSWNAVTYARTTASPYTGLREMITASLMLRGTFAAPMSDVRVVRKELLMTARTRRDGREEMWRMQDKDTYQSR